MPSLGRGANDFLGLGTALGAAGFHCLAVQPRGIAKTLCLPAAQTLHDFAADIATLVELRGAGAIHLVGHAFGNRVVRTLATDRPELVRSVTLLACGGQVEPDEETRALFPNCFELTLPLEERTNGKHRNRTDGVYGIWGHDLENLTLRAARWTRGSDGTITIDLHIDS